MKVLVTGGAGFIGSSVVRLGVANGHTICNIDKLTYAGNLDSLNSVADSKSLEFRLIDICNSDDVSLVFREFQPDAVIHLAAESHVDRSIDGPSDFIETNVVGTFRLLDVCLDYWRELKSSDAGAFRFLHVSTDEVYGDLGPSDEPFNESTAYRPSSPYAATKAASDHLVRAWGRTYGLPVVLTNCSNNYGPYQFPEKLIPHMILSAIAGKHLPVYGDGHQIRDWLYVEDHARALWTVLQHGETGETYNIGANTEMKNIDVVETICELLEEMAEHPANVHRFKELITFVEDRPGHDARYAIDATKIHRELDWEPTETFKSAMRKTVSWYLQNETWWNRVATGAYRLERRGLEK